MSNGTVNKYDFIQQLLENKKLSPVQRERVLTLAIQEMKSEKIRDENLVKRIKDIEEMLHAIRENNENFKPKIYSLNTQNQLTHNPRLVSEYLNKFKENTVFKWTTHPWDEKKFDTIDTFIQELNEDKEYNKLFNVHRDLFNLVNYFIYSPKTETDNGIPKFGWPNLNELKIGWQFPRRILIEWCKENFDNKDEHEIKYPFQYPLPKELQPQKPIKGKMITTFENVVDVFKTEIQFREDYLYKELKKRNNRMLDFKFEGIEDFRNLDYYTYTPGFLAAIDTILAEIKKNETEKHIRFSYEMLKEELIVDVTHVNSFPIRKLNTNNLSQFLGGGLYAIAGSIFSLCDFSVISKFKDDHNNISHSELCIVYDDIKGTLSGKETSITGTPQLRTFNKKIEGFTYRFKFYL